MKNRWTSCLLGCLLVAAPAALHADGNALPGQAQTSAIDGPMPQALGDTAADLVFTPVTPCRIIDTRSAAAGQLVAGAAQSYKVRSLTGFAIQGGSATDCGVAANATSVMFNMVAVGPAGPGDIRATAFGGTLPNASVLNYSNVAGLNIANGLALPVCNPATATCTTADITFIADVASTHLVVDVVGYFKAAVSPVTITLSDAVGSTASTTAVNIASMYASLYELGYRKARLVARWENNREAPACTTGMTLQFVRNGATVASVTETCGIRAWYDESADFDLAPKVNSDGTPYDLQAFVTSAGTGVWRWVGLQVR
jgi:hypothetical protein